MLPGCAGLGPLKQLRPLSKVSTHRSTRGAVKTCRPASRACACQSALHPQPIKCAACACCLVRDKGLHQQWPCFPHASAMPAAVLWSAVQLPLLGDHAVARSQHMPRPHVSILPCPRVPSKQGWLVCGALPLDPRRCDHTLQPPLGTGSNGPRRGRAFLQRRLVGPCP